MEKRAILLMLLVSGCGSSVSADQACTDAATALCTQLQNCEGPVVTIGYGDLATCQARAKLSCTPALMAPGTSQTPEHLDGCAKAAAAVSCGQLFSRDTPDACKPKSGTLADGRGCGDDPQCANSYCKKSANEVCGVCSARAAAGAACDGNDDCDYKLVCAMGLCVAPGAVGASCDDGHPCVTPNVCSASLCAAPVGAGMACDPVIKNCDGTQGLYCDPQTRLCKPAGFAEPGGSCGVVNGGYVACSGGGHCKLGVGSLMGTCLAPAADGAACDPTTGPDCLAPAQCVSSVCKLPNAASCS